MGTFKVYLTAFQRTKPLEFREVTLPDDVDENVDNIFHFGQNEIQPLNKPSVSVGDIIEFKNELYLVNDFGFIVKDSKAEINFMLEHLLENSTEPFLIDNFGYLLNK